MKYKELKKIATPHVRNGDSLPSNAFLLLCQLHISFKSKQQCEAEFSNEMTPLYNSPAFLKINPDGSKTVYFNDKTKYWNFYIFHEIAHYLLGHETNSPQNEQDADLLACILVAPVDNIPSYIKSARDLSSLCQIPIDKAEMYWQNIKSEIIKPKIKISKKSLIAIFIVLLIPLFIGLGVLSFKSYQKKSQENFYMTSEGSHYHVDNCIYIQNKSNVISISLIEAKSLRLLPCSVCIQ